jgi:hypothetical protein
VGASGFEARKWIMRFEKPVVQLLFTCLTVREVLSARTVCKAWQSIRAAWPRIELYKETRKMVLQCSSPYHVRTLVLPVAPTEFPRYPVELPVYSNLDSLLLCQGVASIDCLRYVTDNMPALTRLAVSSHFLQYLPLTLTSLTLTQHSATDADLGVIKQMSQLRELNVLIVINVTDAGFLQLRTLTQLETLILGSCWELSEASFKTLLAHFSNLIKLELAEAWTDQVMYALPCCEKLETLTVKMLGPNTVRMTAACVRGISRLRNLHNLSLLDYSMDREVLDFAQDSLEEIVFFNN